MGTYGRRQCARQSTVQVRPPSDNLCLEEEHRHLTYIIEITHIRTPCDACSSFNLHNFFHISTKWAFDLILLYYNVTLHSSSHFSSHNSSRIVEFKHGNISDNNFCTKIDYSFVSLCLISCFILLTYFYFQFSLL